MQTVDDMLRKTKKNILSERFEGTESANNDLAFSQFVKNALSEEPVKPAYYSTSIK